MYSRGCGSGKRTTGPVDCTEIYARAARVDRIRQQLQLEIPLTPTQYTHARVGEQVDLPYLTMGALFITNVRLFAALRSTPEPGFFFHPGPFSNLGMPVVEIRALWRSQTLTD